MQKTTRVSWRRVQELAKLLARKVRARKFRPDCIVGVTVGGLVPLALLAGELGTKDVATISVRSYGRRRKGKLRVTALPKVDLRGKKVLLVDEIVDGGHTLRHVSHILKRDYGAAEVRAATLVLKKKDRVFTPDFYVLEVGAWVVFPWEFPHG
ncbi:phosphoribosyltransferase [Candidatus Kaiserbacteria bacterium]|nr:phosphoribosyltransferase [Candidatus Kaiserbacteria bacterium]